MNKILLIALIIIAYSCQSISKPSTNLVANTTMNTSNNSLAERLGNDHYGEFYNYALQQQIIDQVWAEAGGIAPLKAVVLDEEATTKARLIAHEILLKKEFTYLGAEDVDMGVIAQIYAAALVENATGMANSWGLLYEHDDLGPVGYFFGHLGEEGLTSLLPLLDNNTSHLYQGSEAATVGNAYQFQVRDFAAYYISKILNEPSPYHAKRADRDKEIERQRTLVKNR